MLYHHLYNNMLYHLFLFGCYITKYGDITTKYGFKNQKKNPIWKSNQIGSLKKCY